MDGSKPVLRSLRARCVGMSVRSGSPTQCERLGASLLSGSKGKDGEDNGGLKSK